MSTSTAIATGATGATGTTDTLWTGRKGIAYDWRSVVAEVEAARLDAELDAFATLAGAES